jgi:hypothetical protein
VSKGQSYYRSVVTVRGSRFYYNCREIDQQAGELVLTLRMNPGDRPSVEVALKEWLAEKESGGEDSDLSLATSRVDQIERKRKNPNRMAAEELISWEESKELRDEIEQEESAPRLGLQMLTQHQALLAPDFELALDIACNLGWLHSQGSIQEKRLLAETLFQRPLLKGD